VLESTVFHHFPAKTSICYYNYYLQNIRPHGLVHRNTNNFSFFTTAATTTVAPTIRCIWQQTQSELGDANITQMSLGHEDESLLGHNGTQCR
jgi:hypothetical protein